MPKLDIKTAYSQGLAFQNAGKLQEAAKVYVAILAQRELAEPAYQMGRMARATGRNGEAAKWFERALRQKPKQVEIWKELIAVLGPADRARAIAQARRQGVILSSPVSKALKDAAGAVRAHDLKRAEKNYRKALAGSGDKAPIWLEWANQLIADEHHEQALSVLDEAIATLATPPLALRIARGETLQTLGDLDRSEEIYRAILADVPGNTRALSALVRLKKQASDSEDMAALRHALEQNANAPEVVRSVSFALAKGFEDQGRDDEAFDHLARANEMTRARFPWDSGSDRDQLGKLIGHWKAREGGYAAAAPIFVVGLPRSGTTLVETILSAHGSVRAGGETGFFTRIFRDRVGVEAGDVPAYDVAGIGRAYAEALAKRIGNADAAIRGTDKSISTYARIGHVLNCLPKARFVVLNRDPMDVGLSIFKNQFLDGTQRFSSGLEDIARQIGFFDGAIRAWTARMPDAMHVVRYEDMVSDPEPQIRDLLAFCGLDWDPACLSPHLSGRAVKTLSSVQVRNPINAGSVGRWRRFEARLAPLAEALRTEVYNFD